MLLNRVNSSLSVSSMRNFSFLKHISASQIQVIPNLNFLVFWVIRESPITNPGVTNLVALSHPSQKIWSPKNCNFHEFQWGWRMVSLEFSKRLKCSQGPFHSWALISVTRQSLWALTVILPLQHHDATTYWHPRERSTIDITWKKETKGKRHCSSKCRTTTYRLPIMVTTDYLWKK